MIRKLVKRFQDFVDAKLRYLCGCIAPEKRLAALLTMFTLFAIFSISSIAYSVYCMGKKEVQQIEIEHIKTLELQRIDSLKPFNNHKYDKE